jgi:hypothetical protein
MIRDIVSIVIALTVFVLGKLLIEASARTIWQGPFCSLPWNDFCRFLQWLGGPA